MTSIADQGSADVAYRTPLAPYEKSKFLGSGGYVARLKLKELRKSRAPPGVETAALFDSNTGKIYHGPDS
ncbi:hypothetical protein Tco_1241612 [Tanacetum coccineum]